MTDKTKSFDHRRDAVTCGVFADFSLESESAMCSYVNLQPCCTASDSIASFEGIVYICSVPLPVLVGFCISKRSALFG